MSAVATAIVGGAVVGGLIQSNAAKSAANTESNASNYAISAQEAMFNQEQANMQPYLNAGYTALGDLNQEMPGWNAAATPTAAQVESTPGYQFQKQETLSALGASESAQGATYGTGTMAAMANYANNVATTGYNNAFQNYQTSINNAYGRLAGIANIGLGGAQNLNNNATAVGANIGNNATAAGTAQAAGTIGSANAINSSIGTATNGLMYNSLMNKLMPQSQTTPQPAPIPTISQASMPASNNDYGNVAANGQGSLMSQLT